MATPEEIREWLRKMKYPDPNPSDKALQTLCRGAVGRIFKQVIEKVKPRQEVEQIRKAILIYHLKQDDAKSFKTEHNIEKLKLYHEKFKLETDLQKLNELSREKELNLELLKLKIKSKHAKQQRIIENIKVYEKDSVLLKAEISNLREQIETCQNLCEESKVLERKTQLEDEAIEVTEEVFTKLTGIISSFHCELSPHSDLTTISENSHLGQLQTSLILSSNKKPLSSFKISTRANSTRKNLAEITNNYSMFPSSSRKNNSSKISFVPSFNSTISCESFTHKKVEVLKELEQICWNDKSVQKLIQRLWESDWDKVFKILCDLKEKHKNKIRNFVDSNEDSLRNSDLKTIEDMEQLYAFHVETEMKTMISLHEQKKNQSTLNKLHSENDVNNISILKAIDHSLGISLEHAKNRIAVLKQEIPDSSEKLNHILCEIENIRGETEIIKTKVESRLNLLRECKPYLEKYKRNVLECIKKPETCSKYKLFKSKVGEENAQKFNTCAFQSQNLNYLNSWSKIYNIPELLELIQHPFLSPENVIKHHFLQKKWLQKLQMFEKELEDEKCLKNLFSMKIMCDGEQMNEKYSSYLEQLKSLIVDCANVLKQSDKTETELKYFLEAPLNSCVAPELKFENRTLKDYVELFDSHYKQIQQ